MVIRYFFAFLFVPLFLFSGAFKASINRYQVGVGESFTLTLTLNDASAKSTPQIDILQRYFQIHSQQQGSHTTIVNGKMTSSLSWKYVLIPKYEGEMIIPAINIETSEGLLSSQPAAISVVKAAPKPAGTQSSNEPSISTSISNRKPYKNEPFFYTIRLTSKQPLVNVQMQKLTIENAIVENAGEPKMFEKIGSGIPEGVVEFSFLITPIKSGQLQIPSHTIQAAVPVRRTLGSMFNDTIDLADLLQGFEQWKPIAFSTEEATIDVQPALAEVNPWLPAKSLVIAEIWDDKQPLQAGELFTRGFNIIAEGVNANQLPSLSDKQIGDNPLKIYADKPEFSTKADDGILKSTRKELYTLIPQQAGTMVLPEITVAWWDVKRKLKVVSTIPSRTIEVLPAAKTESISKPEIIEETVSKQQPVIVSEEKNMWLYAVIGGLVLLLAAIIGWCICLQQKMNSLLHPVKDVKPAEQKKQPVKVDIFEEKPIKSKKEELNDLNPT